MGLTPAVRLENKLTSWVSATDTAQVSSCETTISWKLAPNSKWRAGADFGNQGQEWCRSRSLGEHSISSMHTCYLQQQYQLDKIPTTSPSLKSMSFELDGQGYKVELSLLQIVSEWINAVTTFPPIITGIDAFIRCPGQPVIATHKDGVADAAKVESLPLHLDPTLDGQARGNWPLNPGIVSQVCQTRVKWGHSR